MGDVRYPSMMEVKKSEVHSSCSDQQSEYHRLTLRSLTGQEFLIP
jgi:hypothetical protein